MGGGLSEHLELLATPSLRAHTTHNPGCHWARPAGWLPPGWGQGGGDTNIKDNWSPGLSWPKFCWLSCSFHLLSTEAGWFCSIPQKGVYRVSQNTRQEYKVAKKAPLTAKRKCHGSCRAQGDGEVTDPVPDADTTPSLATSPLPPHRLPHLPSGAAWH